MKLSGSASSESGFAEAGDRVGGLGPQLCILRSSAGFTAYEPHSAPGEGTDGEGHLPFHDVHHSDR